MTPRILVLGVGNPLMRDEGAGPRIAELLMGGFEFPDDVVVMDAGTMGLGMLDLLRGVDHLILVDALRDPELAPGTVVLLRPEDLADSQVMHSLHDMRVSDVLQNAELIGRAPETVIVGIQIESIEQWVLELSEPVAEALPVALAAVLDRLSELGVKVTERSDSQLDAHILRALRTRDSMADGGLRPEEEAR